MSIKTCSRCKLGIVNTYKNREHCWTCQREMHLEVELAEMERIAHLLEPMTPERALRELRSLRTQRL